MSLSGYIAAAMGEGKYRLLEDGSYFGEIPGFKGVWAEGKTLDKCRAELQEVLEEWILLKLRDRDPLPSVKGKSLKIPQPAGA